MKYILAYLRLIAIIVFTSCALITLLITIFFKGNSRELGQLYGRFWGKVVVKLLGIEMKITGFVPEKTAIIISNHRSYADIMLIYRQAACAFVAMAEVKNWPLVGIAAETVGTIFVDRKNPDSRKDTLVQMKKRISEGYSIVICPEGGTFAGPLTKEFKIGSFSLAAEKGIPIVPTAIEYQYVTDAWTDNISMIGHFVQTFGRWKTRVAIHFGEAIYGTEARDLLTSTQHYINMKLVSLRKEFDAANFG